MSARVYVGNLPLDIKESEVDDLFYKYGRIRQIELKTPHRPPAYAFVSFDDSRDADDAVRGRDGYNFDGYRLRVEIAKGSRGDDRGDRRERDREPRRGGGRRSEHGVNVSNLPHGCSWQDLKDFMRKAGDVIYTDVTKNGEGVVEFSNRSDAEHAVRSLDDTEMKSFNESSVIRVKPYSSLKKDDEDRREDKKRSHSRSVSRSRSPARRRSVSRSPSQERDRRSPVPEAATAHGDNN